eukprot:1365759-Amorphochlora_amoeboformis.AAC.1
MVFEDGLRAHAAKITSRGYTCPAVCHAHSRSEAVTRPCHATLLLYVTHICHALKLSRILVTHPCHASLSRSAAVAHSCHALHCWGRNCCWRNLGT